MQWADAIWQAIVAKDCVMASVEGVALCDLIDRTFTRWQLNEISILQIGADAGAVIQRCWERLPYV
jgi:hypothetical protein